MPGTARSSRIEIVKNNFPSMGPALDKAAFELVNDTIMGIFTRAKQEVPIGPTGVLGGSIQMDISSGAGYARGEVVVGADYGAYVNYGTGGAGASSAVPGRGPEISYSAGWAGMPARPFLSAPAHAYGQTFMQSWQRLESYLPK